MVSNALMTHNPGNIAFLELDQLNDEDLKEAIRDGHSVSFSYDKQDRLSYFDAVLWVEDKTSKLNDIVDFFMSPLTKDGMIGIDISDYRSVVKGFGILAKLEYDKTEKQISCKTPEKLRKSERILLVVKGDDLFETDKAGNFVCNCMGSGNLIFCNYYEEGEGISEICAFCFKDTPW